MYKINGVCMGNCLDYVVRHIRNGEFLVIENNRVYRYEKTIYGLRYIFGKQFDEITSSDIEFLKQKYIVNSYDDGKQITVNNGN